MVSQDLGSRKETHQGNPRLLHQWHDFYRGGRAHIAKEGEDFVLNNQPLGVFEAARRVIAIVIGNDPDLAPVNTP